MPERRGPRRRAGRRSIAHDPEQSRELVDWADVVICEWCGPNAVWYSEAQAARISG